MTPFGLKLRELRESRGISMSSMAKHLHVSAAYLSQLETGKKGHPTTVMVDHICAMLGLIWDDAEELKHLAKLSKARVAIDTAALGPEATRAANLLAEVLPRVDDDEAKLMADWLNERLKSL
ncbi:MAG: helix-turn-helix domain-containing protein [Alphaproteobacteria bacterium]|nr:helix-turn-helix domain-containing protein [Alphaproteobacteria bacterium]